MSDFDDWFGIANYRRHNGRRRSCDCIGPVLLGMAFASGFMALGAVVALALCGR